MSNQTSENGSAHGRRAAAGSAYPDGENVVTWDHRQQPPWDEINELLERHDVVIEEIDTGSDEFAVRVKRIVYE